MLPNRILPLDFSKTSRFDQLSRHLVDAGGASSARLLAVAVDAILRSHERIHRATMPRTHFYIQACHLDEGAKASAIIVHLALEKLHTGDWKQVDASWRDLFVIGAMLRIAAEMACSTLLSPCLSDNVKLSEFLQNLNQAALLGGQGFHQELDLAFTTIQSAIAPQPAGENEVQVADRLHDKTETHMDNIWSRSLSHKTWLLGENQLAFLHDTACCFMKLLPEGSLTAATNSFCSPVQCRFGQPSLTTFHRDFMSSKVHNSAGVPVLMHGAVSHWPAISLWQDPQYLSSSAGYRLVPIEVCVNYLHEDWTQEIMTLADFLQSYIRPHPNRVSLSSNSTSRLHFCDLCCKTDAHSVCKGYLAQHALFHHSPSLLRDIDVLDYCMLGENVESDTAQGIAINAWLGPGGTVSPLHMDQHSNLLCQVVGYKYIRLYAPNYARAMYLHKEKKLRNTSQVDLHQETARLLNKFPEFARAHYFDCILKPGDLLYIPPCWFHFVQALTSSFSVSFWWD